jgi:hypothetical protein
MWQVYYGQIGRQVAEWQALRGLHPDAPLVVAGDFNQDRDGSGWYGTRHGRDLLTRALDDAGLTCVTDEDVVATGKLRASRLVDHIAICDRWANLPAAHLTCWEKTDHDGIHLSDHPTVAIDLMPLPSQHRQPQSSTRRRTTPSTRRELSHRGNRMRSSESAGPWPSKFPVLEGGSVTEGLPVWSLNAHIEGRTTGARLPCLTTGCPGWLIGVRWETGQLMRICSEGWTYNPEHQTVRVTGGGEISARFVAPKPLGTPPAPPETWPTRDVLQRWKGWRTT